MDSLIDVLRALAEGARGPAVHALVDVLEAELQAVVSRETPPPAAAAAGGADTGTGGNRL